jgi:hypothetical protein
MQVDRLPVLLILLLVAVFAGCSNTTEPAISPPLEKPQTPPPPPRTHVFYTAEKTVPERFVFAFRDGELFVQQFVPQADGEPVRKLYVRQDLPGELTDLIRSWFFRQQNEMRMLPGGNIVKNGPLAFTRHYISDGPSRGHGWDGFIDDDELRAFLAAVKAAAVAPEHEVESEPAWVTDDNRIDNDFSGTGEPP